MTHHIALLKQHVRRDHFDCVINVKPQIESRKWQITVIAMKKSNLACRKLKTMVSRVYITENAASCLILLEFSRPAVC